LSSTRLDSIGSCASDHSIGFNDALPDCEEIENLINKRHSMMAPLIGFVFTVKLRGRRKLKTLGLHAVVAVLVDVPGIALGVRFAHDWVRLHEPVKPLRSRSAD
jgi:hypothetical protein